MNNHLENGRHPSENGRIRRLHGVQTILGATAGVLIVGAVVESVLESSKRQTSKSLTITQGAKKELPCPAGRQLTLAYKGQEESDCPIDKIEILKDRDGDLIGLDIKCKAGKKSSRR